MSQARQPAGSPEGGQYAATAGAESASALGGPRGMLPPKPEMAPASSLQVGDRLADGEIYRSETITAVRELPDGRIEFETNATVRENFPPYRCKPTDSVFVSQPRSEAVAGDES